MGSVNVKASTRRLANGKVVNVSAHTQSRDVVGDALKAQGRVPIAAQPGTFPNGRSTPSTPAVWEAEKKRRKAEIDAAKKKAEGAAKALKNKKSDTGEAKVEIDPSSIEVVSE